jgi:hypothetical protein
MLNMPFGQHLEQLDALDLMHNLTYIGKWYIVSDAGKRRTRHGWRAVLLRVWRPAYDPCAASHATDA